MPMMSLGMFVFELKSAPYQSLQQQLGWRHPSNSRVGVRPARQYVGPEDEKITLTGVLMPELTGGDPALGELRDMADEGKGYPLIDGNGNVYGMYVITQLSKTKSYFFNDGAARKIEFTLNLDRVDDDTGMLTMWG